MADKTVIRVLDSQGQLRFQFEKEDTRPDIVQLANSIQNLNDAVDLLILDSLGF